VRSRALARHHAATSFETREDALLRMRGGTRDAS
jgi:hypothetical protein